MDLSQDDDAVIIAWPVYDQSERVWPDEVRSPRVELSGEPLSFHAHIVIVGKQSYAWNDQDF